MHVQCTSSPVPPALSPHVFFTCAPSPGEELFFSAGHHGQLAPVAVRADPGRRLAGLDLLLTGSRVPHVRSLRETPFAHPFLPSWSLRVPAVSLPTWGPPFLSVLLEDTLVLGRREERGGMWVQRPVSGRSPRVSGRRDVLWAPALYHPWGSQGVRGFAVGVPGAQASSGGWELAALWGGGGRVHGPCAALPPGLACEARVSASSAVTWGQAASETGAGTGTARAAPRATWTACSWATSTSTSTHPPL